MLAAVRRPVASICAALMALSLVQCTAISRRDAQEVIPPAGGEVRLKNVAGVTLTDGRDIVAYKKAENYKKCPQTQQ